MPSELKVRAPEFDFSDVPVHWAANTELVQAINAGNMVPAYIEPFLIKVMRKAKAQLDPVADADLIEDMDLFNKQEAQHYKLHAAWNKHMREAGYPGMAEIEAAYAADYEQMLATRSLRFLLAYCEGFEASGGGVQADRWVDDDLDPLLGTAEPEPRALWRWHLAEEYEHRTVMFRVYQRLYGKPRLVSWLYRDWAFFYCLRHIGKHVGRMSMYLWSVDQEGLDPGAKAAAQARAKGTKRQLVDRKMVRKMVHVLSPFYDPAKTSPPRDYDKVLARFS